MGNSPANLVYLEAGAEQPASVERALWAVRRTMMPKKALKERRKHPRIQARLALQVERTIKPSTERPMTTESVNISSNGIYCKVGLTILLPSFGRKGKKTQVITCNGVVVRSEYRPGEGEYDLACAYTDIRKDDKLLIEEYIGWRLLQDRVDERLSQP
jgi:hypothetical protein